jgi:hypothetical protein
MSDPDMVRRPEPRAIGNLLGREDAIRSGRCVSCDRHFTREQIGMWPMDTQKEYQVSGACWHCQVIVFEQPTTDCTCDNPCCEADVGVGVITCAGMHCLVHGEFAKATEDTVR